MNTEKLKESRENMGYTMQRFAEILNISKSSYSLWEEGIERIPLERLVDICDFFHFSVDYILDNTSIIKYDFAKKGIDRIKFANNIKELRKELKLTQLKFSTILNLGRTTIINYENGKTLPILDHLIYICEKYSISADYLLGKIDEPKYLK